MSVTMLSISWSVSRGRETEGYNICRLDDTATGKRYRTMGGGYDMTGTVFADWLADVYQSELIGISDQAHARYESDGRHPYNEGLYGMTFDAVANRVTIDGACGMSSIERIARALGLTIQHVVNRRGNLTALIVTEPNRCGSTFTGSRCELLEGHSGDHLRHI